MGVALLCLSLVELTVVHLLVSHWSRTAALVMSLISGVALVTLVGLIKSFRLRPILLEADGLRLRGGVLFDRLIPFSALAHVETEVAPDSVRAPTTWNTAFLSWPNVMLSLRAPLPREGFKRRRPAFHVIDLAGRRPRTVHPPAACGVSRIPGSGIVCCACTLIGHGVAAECPL